MIRRIVLLVALAACTSAAETRRFLRHVGAAARAAPLLAADRRWLVEARLHAQAPSPLSGVRRAKPSRGHHPAHDQRSARAPVGSQMVRLPRCDVAAGRRRRCFVYSLRFSSPPTPQSDTLPMSSTPTSSSWRRPNQAMQLTASKLPIYPPGVCHRASSLRASRLGLAAADLVSR